MTTLSIKRFGLAVGVTFTLIRLGCDLIRVALPHETAIKFFNTLTHGVDWTPISRWSIPLWESALGLVEVFILGWLAGCIVAVLYNLGAAPIADNDSQRNHVLSAFPR